MSKNGGPQKRKAPSSRKYKGSSKKKEIYTYEDDGDEGLVSDNENEVVAADDDESLSGSEVGWNSDDELAYNIGPKGKSGKGKGGKQLTVDSDDEEDEEDEEEDDEDAIDLSEMLNKKQRNGNKKDEKEDYEEEDEESADDESEEEEEDDDELEETHQRLLKAIDHFASTGDETAPTKSSGTDIQQLPESAYLSTQSDANTVSMNALLSALDGSNSQGLSAVKKTLSELEKNIVAPKFVEKVVSDRTERKIAYEGTTKEMDKWQDHVATFRQAKTLDIAQDTRKSNNYKSLVKKYIPSNSMEEEIQMVLVSNKTRDKDALKQEQEVDALGERTLTVEEMRSRQAEIAKTKALLFYEQMKRHRINKIKSKSYHRIKKRQRLRQEQKEADILKDADPEAFKEMQEATATRRIKERMDFKHRSTSKFAKRMLKYSHVNPSMREAYNETLQLGNELREKVHEDINAREGDDSDHGSVDSLSDDNEEEEDGEKKSKSRVSVAFKASKALRQAGILDPSQSEIDPEVQGKYKNLFNMDFMKRAQAEQKEKAHEEAMSVLREIEDMERGDGGKYGDSDDEDDLFASNSVNKRKKAIGKGELTTARKEVDDLLQTGSSMRLSSKNAKFVSKGSNGGAVSVSKVGHGYVEEDNAPQEENKSLEDEDNDDKVENNPWLQAHAEGEKKKKPKKGKKGAAQKDNNSELYISLDALIDKKHPVEEAKTDNGEVNSKQKNKKQKKGKKGVSDDTSMVNGSSTSNGNTQGSTSTDVHSANPKSLIATKTQAEMVQAAFSGPNLEEEFETFKKGVVDAETGLAEKEMDIIKNVKAGWGDWAGPDKQVSDKILSKRDKLMAKAKQEADAKKAQRQDKKKPNVIISSRRVKTAAKFKVADVPHPFRTREEYERSIRMPIGEEWNASNVVRVNTKPEVLLRAGRVVEAAKLTKKQTQDAKIARLKDNLPVKSITKTKAGGGIKRKFKP